MGTKSWLGINYQLLSLKFHTGIQSDPSATIKSQGLLTGPFSIISINKIPYGNTIWSQCHHKKTICTEKSSCTFSTLKFGTMLNFISHKNLVHPPEKKNECTKPCFLIEFNNATGNLNISNSYWCFNEISRHGHHVINQRSSPPPFNARALHKRFNS